MCIYSGECIRGLCERFSEIPNQLSVKMLNALEAEICVFWFPLNFPTALCFHSNAKLTATVVQCFVYRKKSTRKSLTLAGVKIKSSYAAGNSKWRTGNGNESLDPGRVFCQMWKTKMGQTFRAADSWWQKIINAKHWKLKSTQLNWNEFDEIWVSQNWAEITNKKKKKKLKYIETSPTYQLKWETIWQSLLLLSKRHSKAIIKCNWFWQCENP